MCQCSEEGLVRYSDFKESVNKEFKKLTNSTTLQEFEEEIQNNYYQFSCGQNINDHYQFSCGQNINDHDSETFKIHVCLLKPWLVLESTWFKRNNPWNHEHEKNYLPINVFSICDWYLADMKQLPETDPEIWKFMQDGNFIV